MRAGRGGAGRGARGEGTYHAGMAVRPVVVVLSIATLLVASCARYEPPGPPSVPPPPTNPPAASASGGPTATPGGPTATPGGSATPGGPATPGGSDAFTLAIEYGVAGLGETYGREGAGLSAAKPALEFTVWGNIEPERGRYEWRPFDALVEEYQSAGLTHLQVLLSAESPWASRRPPKGLDRGDHFPKDEFLDDYVRFVTAVVERYDGDGTDDAPGLLAGIHEWGVEREFTGFWPGSADDYIRLLRLAAPAIRAADPQAPILLVAILAIDVFDAGPAAGSAEVERRWATTPSFRKSRAEIEAILAACDAYDVVDFHSLGDYTEIPATAEWLRETGRRLGCERPIWVGDAFSMSVLVGFGDPFGIVAPRVFAPAAVEQRDAVIAALEAVGDRSASAAGREAAVAWLRAELARGVVRKAVAAAGEGLAGINLGNQEDWPFSVRAYGTANYMGLTDTRLTLRHGGGVRLPYGGAAFNRIHEAGEVRPGFEALALANRQLTGLSPGRAARLDLGPGVWAYRFDRASGGPLWVLWYDDGRLRLPGEALPSVTVELPFDSQVATLARTPTVGDAGGPTTERVESVGGVLTLELDATPVFVEVAGS